MLVVCHIVMFSCSNCPVQCQFFDILQSQALLERSAHDLCFLLDVLLMAYVLHCLAYISD